mgnify:CR=1 FL=1
METNYKHLSDKERTMVQLSLEWGLHTAGNFLLLGRFCLKSSAANATRPPPKILMKVALQR